MAYWLDLRDREWGFDSRNEAEKLRVADSHRDEKEVQLWIDHFVELMEDKRTTQIVKDRAEFEFLYRCLERLGKPLAFSPIDPNIESETHRLFTQAA